MDSLVLENAHLRMRVSPRGAAVLSLDSLAFQQPVLRAGEGNAPDDCGLFPMLPLANRVARNRFMLHGREIELPSSLADEHFFLHGDGWLARWEVTERSRQWCVLRLRQRHICGFDYQAEVIYQLSENALHISLEVEHRGKEPMLYGGGVHPFFPFTPQSRVQFSASGFWPEGELHLPKGWTDILPAEADFSTATYGTDAWLNVGYSGWNGRAVITHPAMTVTLQAPTSWLMLFRLPGEPFICLEPQSHPVNAHNLPGQPGLVLLSQGEIWRFSTSILVNSPLRC